MEIDKNCIAFVDIETQGLDGPIVLVEALFLNLDTGEEEWIEATSSGQVKISPLGSRMNIGRHRVKEALEDCLFVVMHNGVGFDVPRLAEAEDELIECDPVSYLPTNIEILDTLVLSRMLCPERKSHSLAAWGADLGFPKGNFDWEDWDGTVTPELIKYCKQDVEVTRRVFFHLQDLMTTTGGNWRKAHDFEYQCQASVDNQGSFYMQAEKAKDVLELLALEMEKIRCVVYDDLPMVDLPKSKIKHPPAKQFKQDGTPSAHALRYFPNVRQHLGKWVFDHPIHGRQALPWAAPIHTQERANFDSTGPLKDWLLEYGWKPTYWNFKDGVRKGPRFQDDNKNVDPALLRLGVSWVPELQRYLTLKHRFNTVVGWR
ncbi:MAG: PolC-type DNA polymerase III domain-containing protein, partial [Methanosarcinales archaeon]